jgi:DNA (cytosine-5)-methyltransferase 1
LQEVILRAQDTSFASLCASAHLTTQQAAVLLGLSDAELTELLEEGRVPVSIQNALRTEAMFQGTKHITPSPFPLKLKSLTCVSLFSGAGGLDIGLEQAGFSTLFANEVEKYACETLRQNKNLSLLSVHEFDNWFDNIVSKQRCYVKTKKSDMVFLKERLLVALKLNFRHLQKAVVSENDIREISSEEILNSTGALKGEIDLIAGGPPCQPFSRAGKRETVECEKGQLFMEFVRLVDGIRPRWFLFENVKGLILHNVDVAHAVCASCKHQDVVEFETRERLKDNNTAQRICNQCGFSGEQNIVWRNKRGGSLDIIRAEFERLGYHCYDKVLNAADFGAPQSRERIFIVGSRDNEAFTWPKPTHCDPKLLNTSVLSLFDRVEDKLPWRTAREAIFDAGHWRYGDLDSKRAVLWVKNVVRPQAFINRQPVNIAQMFVTCSHRTAPFQPTGSCPVALTFGTRDYGDTITVTVHLIFAFAAFAV